MAATTLLDLQNKNINDKGKVPHAHNIKLGWIVKTYKARGGMYEGSPRKKSSLKRWFSEKRVDATRIGRSGSD